MPIIYALKCPVTGEIRYIGKSSRPERRVRSHINEAARGIKDHHNARWLRKLLAAGHQPEIVELLKVPSGADWDALERFMIASAKSFGFRLTNSTAGGEGFDNTDSDVNRRWLANLRASNKRPEVIERKTAASRRRAADPMDGIAKSVGCKRRYEDPQQRASLSAKHKAQWANPEWAAKTTAAIRISQNRPEVRAGISAGNKLTWQDETVRTKRLASMRDPQCVARKAATSKSTWAASSAEAKQSRLAGLAKYREARRLETLRRIMEWDTV